MDWRKIERELREYFQMRSVDVGSAPNFYIYVNDGSHDGYVPISLALLAEHLATELKPELSK